LGHHQCRIHSSINPGVEDMPRNREATNGPRGTRWELYRPTTICNFRNRVGHPAKIITTTAINNNNNNNSGNIKMGDINSINSSILMLMSDDLNNSLEVATRNKINSTTGTVSLNTSNISSRITITNISNRNNDKVTTFDPSTRRQRGHHLLLLTTSSTTSNNSRHRHNDLEQIQTRSEIYGSS
jgi:hypothetical protein